LCTSRTYFAQRIIESYGGLGSEAGGTQPADRLQFKEKAMKLTPEYEDALRRRLNDGGCPVLRNNGYKIRPVGLAIESIPGATFNRIFPLVHGGTGYYFDVVLRNESDHPITLWGFQIKTPWGVPRISLLPAPKKSSERYPLYCFPEPGPYCEGEYALNPFFARHKRLLPGEEFEGSLLASSKERIPADIAHLAAFFVTLTIFDSSRNGFSGRFGLRVYRSEVVAREYANLRAQAEVEQESQGGESVPHSLVAPPAPVGLSEPVLDQITRDLLECMAAIKSKR